MSTDSPVFYKCPKCDKTSFNPHDVDNHYCGFCHVFLDDLRNEQVTDFLHLTPTYLTRKDCFSLALLALVDSGHTEATLVHAWVYKTITGKPEEHAWCEAPAEATYSDGSKGEITVVVDLSQPHIPSRIAPVELIYPLMDVRQVKRYTLKEALARAVSTGHDGPWEPLPR